MHDNFSNKRLSDRHNQAAGREKSRISKNSRRHAQYTYMYVNVGTQHRNFVIVYMYMYTLRTVHVLQLCRWCLCKIMHPINSTLIFCRSVRWDVFGFLYLRCGWIRPLELDTLGATNAAICVTSVQNQANFLLRNIFVVHAKPKCNQTANDFKEEFKIVSRYLPCHIAVFPSPKQVVHAQLEKRHRSSGARNDELSPERTTIFLQQAPKQDYINKSHG